MADIHQFDRSNSTGVPPFYRRISWGAIFAGLILVLAIQLVLSLLGLSIGAGTVDPLTEVDPVKGLGTGALAWFGISLLVALFIGGWAAGRLSGSMQRMDSALHGLLCWGVSSLALFYLMTTGIGSLFGATSKVLGSTLAFAGKAAASAVPQIAQATGLSEAVESVDWSDIKQEANQLLRQTKKPALQPNRIEAEGQKTVTAVTDAAEDTAKNPGAAEASLEDLMQGVFSRAQATVSEVDREAIINVLVSRTDMSREQAGQTVDRWQNTFAQAKAKAEQAKAKLAQQAKEAGDKAARAVSQAALVAFIALVLGAAAASTGGFFGGRPMGAMPTIEFRQEVAA